MTTGEPTISHQHDHDHSEGCGCCSRRAFLGTTGRALGALAFTSLQVQGAEEAAAERKKEGAVVGVDEEDVRRAALIGMDECRAEKENERSQDGFHGNVDASEGVDENRRTEGCR
ncbi:MAG: hypothetical protein ACOC8H_02130 [bacterium]